MSDSSDSSEDSSSSSIVSSWSEHGVSCDSCLKGNFRGRRYKCLICYDYDLCAACYEAGATNTRHNVDHPMQCILTRTDYELYYGGEALTNIDQPQSYTCPYCSRMGFTDTSLQEHVTTDHADTSFEVVCPVCAAMPGGEPNLMTDDFAGHLMLEHRTGPRDLISFLDEPVGRTHSAHNMRRIPHHLSSGRGGQCSRPRRSNMHFSSAGLTSLSPSSRETVDPIAELLSQLSGVRRSASNTSSSTPTQLQQLQMQLQLERQQVNAARQQLERLPRRQIQNQNALRESSSTGGSNGGIGTSLSSTLILNPTPSTSQTANANATPIPPPPSNFLLSGLLDEISLSSRGEDSRFDRSSFVQDLILSTLVKWNKNNEDEGESNTAIALTDKGWMGKNRKTFLEKILKVITLADFSVDKLENHLKKDSKNSSNVLR
ncbi:E3 ubiquitin-protein ligase KCMF1-like isoform X2 [Agrilus planipennis]|uniref:RING-type E3 ubiquitin transferase n=1 Tax=Agrilus planipennis TaxID=224129 RepID=A0A7F5R5S8_AGRPL|nr:E3 ubiquitin-protein ligase KCMF1-like isoform X2 [Agrilus planipennis]